MRNQFRFLHDRIQQAAFDCIPDEAKKDFRLHDRPQIDGRLEPRRRARSPTRRAEQSERRLPSSLRTRKKSRAWRASTWWRDAGPGKPSPIRMRLATSRSGSACSAKRAWQTDYDLAFELHSEAFECEYLTANFERADQLFKALIANARSKLDKAQDLPHQDPARHQRGALRGGHQGRDRGAQAVRHPLPQTTFEAASADPIDAGAPAPARPPPHDLLAGEGPG